ncbi:MAG: TetR/AcrR family transcriptional regulator [Opitutaceae bacterium]|nr:TetR/AcrR family transcriptional regulator [Opitutaceae bacterium]
MKRPSTYHHGNLRAALIGAGVKLLARKGLAAMTLRAVAAQAGVSPAAPYRHFENVAALAAAIAEEGFGRLREAMAAALADPALKRLSPLERTGCGYARFALANPDHLRLMFAGPRQEGPEHAAAAAAGERAFALLVEVIEQGKKDGLVRQVPTPALAVAAWALIHGLSLLLVGDQLEPVRSGAVAPEALVVSSVKLLREGWAA